MQTSLLLEIPLELRMMVYEYLFDVGQCRQIVIGNKPGLPLSGDRHKSHGNRRTVYHVHGKSFDRRLQQTTYGLKAKGKIHPEILSVNRKIRQEASTFLYGMHSFHFGQDIEAVGPFLQDITPPIRQMLKEITLQIRVPLQAIDLPELQWLSICQSLKHLPALQKLKVMVVAGRPSVPWDGPHALTVSDLKLLYAIRHECLDWIRGLADVGTISQIEICPSFIHAPPPTTTQAIVLAAFSASIETTLIEFLCTELEIPAIAGEFKT